MDSRGDTTSAGLCLEEQLTRAVHEFRHGKKAQPPLEQIAHSLSKLYETNVVQAACQRVSSNLPPAIADTQSLVEELQILIELSAFAAANTLQESTSDLNILSERISLLWQMNDLSTASSDYNRLLETTHSSRTERTTALWQINNLLALLARDNSDIANSRAMTMQAMFCARGLGDTEKIERSEFSLACTLSNAREEAKLKDNFVVLRSAVLGEKSLLPISQQQLVLIYSARDFCRRGMLASAQWILEIAEEYTSQMLPPDLANFYTEKARFFELSNQKKNAKEALSKVEELNKKHRLIAISAEDMLASFQNKDLALTACTIEKKQLLDLFLEQYSEVSTTLQ